MTPGVCKGCGAPLPPNRGPSTPRIWCSERCRKRQYDRECIDCGARTSGTDPGTSRGRCSACARAAALVWTPEAIVEAIQAWAAEYGAPPLSTDWKAGGYGHPSATTVVATMGWSNAIRAAGFDAIPRGHHRQDLGPGEIAEIVERYRAGESRADLAEEFCVCHQTIQRYTVGMRCAA